jgi:hypothetical protein
MERHFCKSNADDSDRDTRVALRLQAKSGCSTRGAGVSSYQKKSVWRLISTVLDASERVVKPAPLSRLTVYRRTAPAQAGNALHRVQAQTGPGLIECATASEIFLKSAWQLIRWDSRAAVLNVKVHATVANSLHV